METTIVVCMVDNPIWIMEKTMETTIAFYMVEW